MPVASFDIECEDWDGFVVGAVHHTDGTVAVHWDEDALFDEILTCSGDVWTWAGGRYDMSWFAEVAERRGIEVVARVAGGAPVSMKCGPVVLRDGFKLFPEKLKDVAPLAKLEKAPTGLKCKRTGKCEERDCGGYCRIKKHGMSRAERKALVDYLVHDTRCTSGVIQALQELAAELNIKLKSTVGASAWSTLASMHGPSGQPVPDAEWHQWRDYRAARRGYYGGRTELYQTGNSGRPGDTRAPVDMVWRADINSAYPAALKNVAVPVGDYKRVFGDEASRAFAAGLPGIYDARVVVPECHVPALPVRGRERLLFVTGRFAGSWTHLELANAMAHGVTVERITAAIVWTTAEKIAQPFVDKFWALRSTYGKKTPQGRWLKWFCNSCTGKLAMRPEGERCYVNPAKVKPCPADGHCMYKRREGGPALGPLCGRIGTCCAHHCTGHCGKWSPIDKRMVIWSAPEHRLSDCSHVHWAATLTAVTRIEWFQQAVSVGDALVYGDTDSIYAACPITRRIGSDLGYWNNEGVWLDWYARGPKAYRGAKYLKGDGSLDDEFGEYETKSKGVPGLNGFSFDAWAAGRPIELDGGVWGFKGGARRGDLFLKKSGADGGAYKRAAKANPAFAGSRVVNADGTTRPMTYDEYQSHLDSGSFKPVARSA